MKSQPLRKDKHCLNCGAEVPERYCTHCGQENAVPHETFSHLVKHFVADIFHYDSQFLTTLKYLLFRPGFLSREYMAGKRVRYVNPIKLYVFVSFVFFFTVFSLYHSEKEEKRNSHALVDAKIGKDSLRVMEGADAIRQIFKDDSSAVGENMTDLADNFDRVKTIAQFDSVQQALPDSLKLTGAKRLAYRRLISIKEKYGEGDTQKAMVEMFTHNIPKMMFVLLPLFALFMKWIYDKKWLYADHAIFAIHLHSFAFIVGLAGFLLDLLFHSGAFVNIAWWLFFAYLVLALYNNYKQSLWKSFLKSIFLFVSYFFAILLVFTGYVGLMFLIFL